jgi:Tfp pilus assembly protein PilE
MKKLRGTGAFTLVEVVVVVFILAILGKLGYVSYEWYTISSRDGSRIASIASIAEGFESMLMKWSLLPMPNGPVVTLTASGITAGYQGCAGSGVLGIISVTAKTQDPVNNNCYTYRLNASQEKYQVLGLLESKETPLVLENPLVPSAYAGPYDTRIPVTRGSKLGVLLWSGANLNQPVQEISTAGIEFFTATGNYVLQVDNKTRLSWTGSMLTYWHLISDDASKLVTYLDMETQNSQALFDASGYDNIGRCYPSIGWALVACGTTGPTFVSSGKLGKAMSFDGANWHVQISANDETIKDVYPVTISVWIYPTASQYDKTIVAKHGLTAIRIADTGVTATANKINIGRQGCGNWISNATLANNQWSHIVLTSDSVGDVQALYINGVLDSSGAIPACSLSGISDLFVGWWLWATFQGYIDEVRLYKRVLTAAEVQALYANTK